MTDQLTNQYPNDRHNGFVMLIDGVGEPYIFDCPYPYRGGEIAHAMQYAGAFLILANRFYPTNNE